MKCSALLLPFSLHFELPKTLHFYLTITNAAEKPALHIVSAFAVEAGISITQKSCDTKSNEITTIPDILNQIEKGSIIPIDAMGCQKGIAKKIVNNKSDYILAVKQN